MALDRLKLGQERVGRPITETFEALVEVVGQKGWKDFNQKAAVYYFEKMPGHWVPSLIDAAVTDDDLDMLSSNEVQILCLLLIRDMFRHNASMLRRARDKGGWVDALFEEIADKLCLPAKRFSDDGKPYQLEDIESREWAEKLAAPIGLKAAQLFACHQSIVTGVVEEVGRKAWWKFW